MLIGPKFFGRLYAAPLQKRPQPWPPQTPSLLDRSISTHTMPRDAKYDIQSLAPGRGGNERYSELVGHVSITTRNRYIEIDLAMKEKASKNCELVKQNESVPC